MQNQRSLKQHFAFICLQIFPFWHIFYAALSNHNCCRPLAAPLQSRDAILLMHYSIAYQTQAQCVAVGSLEHEFPRAYFSD